MTNVDGREDAGPEDAGLDDAGLDDDVRVDARVRVFPSTDREACGVVVDDFGNEVGIPVEIGGDRIVEAARRWAVRLDDDGLVFVDSENLVLE